MKNNECADPECLGCLTLEFVGKLKDAGAEVDDILKLVAAACGERFGEAVYLVAEGQEEGTIH